MKAIASRAPDAPIGCSAVWRDRATWRRLTTSPANPNAATVTEIATPTPNDAMRTPASGAPRRYPTCSAEVNNAFARSRGYPWASATAGTRVCLAVEAAESTRVPRNPSSSTCQTSRRSSASSTGSGATTSALATSARAPVRTAPIASTIRPAASPPAAAPATPTNTAVAARVALPVVVSTSQGTATVRTTFPLSDTAFASTSSASGLGTFLMGQRWRRQPLRVQHLLRHD